MPFPDSREGLEAVGYRFDTVGQCRGACCRGEIHWWWSPRGARVPLNPDCSSHHATCPDVAQFRVSKSGRRGKRPT